MPATIDSNGNKTLLPAISAVPTSALLEPRQDSEGFSPTPAYGAFVPADEFFPLGGGGNGDDWGQVRGPLGLAEFYLFMCNAKYGVINSERVCVRLQIRKYCNVHLRVREAPVAHTYIPTCIRATLRPWCP